MGPLSFRLSTGFSDATVLQDIARRAWPSASHPGGLGWALARSQVADRIAVFSLGDRPIGWAGVDGARRVSAQIDPRHGRHARHLVDWCLEASDAEVLEISLGDHDVDLIAAVCEVGFETGADTAPIFGMFRPARPATAPPPPPGYAIRATTPEEVTARVEVHRAAWLPAGLPWHPDHRPSYPPGAMSSYDLATHERVTRTPLYDLDLDLVVETSDGSLVGCCIAWLDPRLAVAEIEPLGVDPAHRRKGLAVALCHEAVARVARRGALQVFINAGPRGDYPATAAAYAKAGFVTCSRGRTYRLERR